MVFLKTYLHVFLFLISLVFTWNNIRFTSRINPTTILLPYTKNRPYSDVLSINVTKNSPTYRLNSFEKRRINTYP